MVFMKMTVWSRVKASLEENERQDDRPLNLGSRNERDQPRRVEGGYENEEGG